MALPYAAIGLGLTAVDLAGKFFGKSDKEIRQQRIREYVKRRAARRDQSLARLSEETGKNIGRINQYTTGTLKRTQGDIGARAASRGVGADEADFLAAQGQITGQGSEAIQGTQDAADRARRMIEESYDRDAASAEMEGIFAPEDPGITDVLGSLASPVLQYGMNQEYLDRVYPKQPRQIPANFTVGERTELPDTIPVTDRVTSTTPRRRRLPNTYYPSTVGGY